MYCRFDSRNDSCFVGRLAINVYWRGALAVLAVLSRCSRYVLAVFSRCSRYVLAMLS